jgi:hypothetical protein
MDTDKAKFTLPDGSTLDVSKTNMTVLLQEIRGN